MSGKTASLSSAFPGLSVATYLTRPLHVHLLKAVSSTHHVHCTHSWAELTTTIRREHVDVVIVDPAVETPPATEIIARLISSFPSVAFVAYTVLKPETVNIIAELSRHGLFRVVVYGYDDSVVRFSILFEEIPPRFLLPHVSFALRTELGRLPQDIQQRVRDVLTMPMQVKSATELARHLCIARSHLYDTFREAGLGPPGRLLVGARLLRAYTYLRDPGHSLQHVAVKTGWNDQRALKRYLTGVFGMPVKALRRCEDTDRLVRKLVRWMRTGW